MRPIVLISKTEKIFRNAQENTVATRFFDKALTETRNLRAPRENNDPECSNAEEYSAPQKAHHFVC